MLKPRFNLWLENEGEVALSRWRVGLLEAIQRTGSISAAAEELKVPYRRAWERLHEMESRLGFPLVDTLVGGATGGGANLTPEADELIRKFHAFADGLESEIEQRYHQAFAEG
jgi:molybdate transport system regulatory protein